MQAGGRFIEQIERLAGVGPSKLGGEFDALGFAAGECRGALAEREVIEADVAQRLQDAADFRNVGEQLDGLAARHVEHVGDALAVEVHFEHVAVVALAAAGVALDPDIGQEVHLDANLAVAFAGFAAAAGDVEAEAPRGVAAQFRFGELREQLADQIEHAGVGGGVRGRRVAERLLIDADHFVDQLDAADRFVRAGNGARAVQRFGELVVEHVFDERALAAAADAGDGDERAEREFDVDVFEIVVARADDFEASPMWARGDSSACRSTFCR